MLKLNDEFTLDGETWRLVSMNMAADYRPLEIIAVPARPIKPAGQIPPRSSDRPAQAPPVTTSKPDPQYGTRFAPSEAPFMKLAREAMEQKAERDRIVAAFEAFDPRCTAKAPCGHCMAWLVANPVTSTRNHHLAPNCVDGVPTSQFRPTDGTGYSETDAIRDKHEAAAKANRFEFEAEVGPRMVFPTPEVQKRCDDMLRPLGIQLAHDVQMEINQAVADQLNKTWWSRDRERQKTAETLAAHVRQNLIPQCTDTPGGRRLRDIFDGIARTFEEGRWLVPYVTGETLGG